MPLTTDLVFSARGCRGHAQWALRWNNPRLHRPERRKTWLACPTHRDTLSEFLTVRGFLRETVPTDQLPADEPAALPAAEQAALPAAEQAAEQSDGDQLGAPSTGGDQR
jgi:hypothetical protein